MKARCHFIWLWLCLSFALGWSARSADDLVSSLEQNWPAWRGPLANGVAPQGDPPLTWSETNHVKWDDGKLDVLATNRLEERFDASPAVAGRDLFLRGREFLYCLSEQ